MKASKSKRQPMAKPAAPPAVSVNTATNSEWWPYLAGSIAAIVAVFLVYGPALGGPLLLDDTYLPFAQSAFARASLSSWMAGTRPILMLSYWLNFQQAGQEPAPYHYVNAILHLLNGLCVWLILRRILSWANFDRPEREIFAAFGMGLFLLHPLQTESVAYIASRSETLSVFFFLAAFTVFVCRRSENATWGISTAVLILFGLACLTKEHAVALPALMILTDYFWNPGFSVVGIKRNWRVYAPILAGGVVATGYVVKVLSASTSAGFGMKDLSWYQYFFTQCRAVWNYFVFFFLPLGQNIDHDFPVSKTLGDYGAFVGLIGLVVLMGAAWWARRRLPLVSYGVFAVLILLAPTSSFIPIRDTLIERRMYLPFIGFLCVAIGLLSLWKVNRMTLVMTLAGILVVESAFSYGRNQLWGDAIAMWTDSVQKSPNKVRPRFQLAYAYYGAGKCAEAVDQFAKTAQLDKPTAPLLVDWALAADCAGNFNAALQKLRDALEMEKTAHIYTEIAREHAKLNQFPQALDALAEAAKIDPNYEMIYAYRGRINAMRGDKIGAAADYRRALEIDPQNQQARQGLDEVSRP